MKIIVGKKEKLGVPSSDSPDLQKYFELGWELTVSRMLCYKNFALGSTVITSRDRQFLYPGYKTAVYEEYSIDNSEFDLCLKYNEFLNDEFKKINYTSDLRENLCNFIKSDILIPSEKFVAIQLRNRAHNAINNYNKEEWLKLLNYLDNNNIKYFIFGQDNGHSDSISLQDWCTLINNKNCIFSIGCMSGAMICNMFFNTGSYIVLDKLNQLSTISDIENNPLFFGNIMNFSGSNKKIAKNINDIIEMVKNGI